MNNILALAYLGDSVYEVYVRKYLIKKGVCKVNNLSKQAINYVSAKAQDLIVKDLIKNNLLKEEELQIYYRGRNHKSHKSPKNTDIITYKSSTGFEAIIGYLELNNKERLNSLMDYIMKE